MAASGPIGATGLTRVVATGPPGELPMRGQAGYLKPDVRPHEGNERRLVVPPAASAMREHDCQVGEVPEYRIEPGRLPVALGLCSVNSST